MRASLVLCGLLAVALGTAHGAKTSPVQKVVELLDDLRGKCVANLGAEEKEMDAYLEYCDDERKTKDYAVKTATRESADLEAAIGDANAQITELSEEITELGSTISAREGELAEAKKVRAAGKADFENVEKDLQETLDEMSGAEATIKREMSFLQVRGQTTPTKKQMKALMSSFQRIVSAAWVDQGSKRRLKAFLQQKEGANDELSIAAFKSAQQTPQASVDEYSSHSGGILDTVTDMREKAEVSLSDARKKEMKNAHAHKMLEMNLNDQIKLLNKKLGDATANKAAASESQGKASGELAEVQKSMAADKDYIVTLTTECSEKNGEWQERKESSNAETATIDKAKEILKGGVVAAFMQTGDIGDEKNVKNRLKLQTLLSSMGKKYKSFALMELASAAQADPFGKVKGLIEDMVTKLLNEASEEADQKNFCDEELAKSTKTKEDKSMSMDKYQARMDNAATTKAELEEGIRVLQQEMAVIDKTQAEATSLREQEKTTYLKAKADYSQSAEAVERAVTVLKNYYEGNSFLQKNTVVKSSKATTTQPSFGSANTDAGGSIISVLEVAASDFTKLLAETETNEAEAVKAFDKLSQENAVSKASKTAEVEGKQSEINSLSVSLEHYKEDHSTVAKELDAVMDYLDKLKPQCTTQVMSYEERKARREAEIEGLKEALAILEGETI